MKKLLLLLSTVLLVFLSVACNHSANALITNNNHVIVDVINNANFDVYRVQINVYKNGALKSTQNSMYADHSKVNKGDSLNFEFTEQDFSLGGHTTLEFLIVDKDNSETLIDSMTLGLSRNKEYIFEISGDSITSPVLTRVK